jgi:beta-glucosidase
VDFETLERTPKASFFWFQELVEERDLAAAAGAVIAQALVPDLVDGQDELDEEAVGSEAPDDGASLGAGAQ